MELNITETQKATLIAQLRYDLRELLREKERYISLGVISLREQVRGEIEDITIVLNELEN